MEMMQELLMAASVAFIVYLFISKLVSNGGDHVAENETVVKGVKLKVKGTKRKKKVHFVAAVDDFVVCKVDKYEGTSSVDNLEGFVETYCGVSGGLVPDETSGLSVEPPKLGFVVDETVGITIASAGEDDCSADEEKIVFDEIDWEKVVKLGSEDDDLSSLVKVVKFGEDQGSEIVGTEQD